MCFDLGGVLVEICRSWHEACGAAGLEIRQMPAAFERERSALADRYQLGHLDDAEYYAQVSEATHGAYARDEIEAIHHAWTRSEYPGIARLLSELSERDDVLLACLSNTNASHWSRLAPLASASASEYPSLRRLQVKLASHLLGLAKPDPLIYKRAQQEFAVAAADILFFDDLASNVSAANRSGWRAHPIDPHDDPASQLRGHLVRSRLL